MRKILTALLVAIATVGSNARAESKEWVDPAEKLKPFDLKCPHTNSGVFELLAQNSAGRKTKLVAVFKDASRNSTINAIEYYELGASATKWERIFRADVHNKKNNQADKVTIGKVLRLVNPIMLKVCNGTSEQKERFEKYLRANAAELQAKP